MEIFWFFCFSVIEIVAARYNNLQPKMSCPGAGFVIEENKCIKRIFSSPKVGCGMKHNSSEYHNLKKVMEPYNLKADNMLKADNILNTDSMTIKKHLLNEGHKKTGFSTILSNMNISSHDMPQILSSLKYMSKMGIKIQDLLKMGFSINEIIKIASSKNDMSKIAYALNYMSKIGISVHDLFKMGISTSHMLKVASSTEDMARVISAFDEMLKKGISPNDLLKAFSSLNDVLNADSLPNDTSMGFSPKIEPEKDFSKNNQCVTKEIVNPTMICNEGSNLVDSLCQTVANPEVTCPAGFLPAPSDGEIVECFTLFEEEQSQGFSESGNRSSPKEIIKPVVRCKDGFTFHDSECVKLSLPQQSCPVNFTLEGDQCSQKSVSRPALECCNECVLKDNKCIFTEEAMPLFSCSRPYKLKNRRCRLF